jgi:UDP-glucose 4-epimerase/UDP-glucuronate decarboxylase
MTRRILIAGGAGFVGFHVASRLAREPDTELVLVDNLRRGRLDADLERLLAGGRVRLVQGDLTTEAIYTQLGEGYAEVYHLAAVIGVKNVIERPYDVIRINALATLKLLDWFVAGGGQRFLFASTSEAYAWTQQFHALPVPTPENVPLALTDLSNPRSSYAGSKIFGELAVTHACARHQKPFAIVRFHNIYGPRMGYEHVIPELYGRTVAGENPLVVYSADHRRAFCYVDDAVDLMLLALREKAGEGQTFNVGNDREEITMGDLAKKILAGAGVTAAIEPRAAANDPIRRRCPDVSKARMLFGYDPRVSLDEGLDRTLAWYAKNPKPQAAP